MPAMRTLGLCVVVVLMACGGDALLGQGKQCRNSVECAAGLLCDYGQDPPVCSPMDTVGRDMVMIRDMLKPADMGADDMSANPSDMSGVVVDMTGQAQPDMTDVRDLFDTDGP